MKRYLVKRVLLALGILFSISLITFFILNIMPGDPVALMLGDTADPNTIETVRHNLGMDKPYLQQYLEWIAGAFTGDLGTARRWPGCWHPPLATPPGWRRCPTSSPWRWGWRWASCLP